MKLAKGEVGGKQQQHNKPQLINLIINNLSK
jgi:hypothetical protein